MKKHFLYLRYVLKHKWFVLLAGIKLNIPLWRLLIHDWQKFTPTEWNPYVLNFFGGYSKDNKPQWLKDKFDKAWLHHIHFGPHHWQYWLLKNEPLNMPMKYRQEMLADWMGAGKAITGKDDTLEFYKKNYDTIILHPDTRKWINYQLGITNE